MRIEDHRLSFLTAHLVVSIFEFYERKTASFIFDHESMDTVSVYYVGERVGILKIPAFCVFSESGRFHLNHQFVLVSLPWHPLSKRGMSYNPISKLHQKFPTIQKEIRHLKKHLAKKNWQLPPAKVASSLVELNIISSNVWWEIATHSSWWLNQPI